MANKKRRQQTGARCPKCRAKMVIDEWSQRCKRCGYAKRTEPSNLTKRLMEFF